MANSIPEAWIASYLVDVGESYGYSLATVPLHGKKKARWTQTLSYEDSAETYVWAKISDHVHEIPARFTKDAITEYNKLFPNRKFVSNTGAIITISNFKPMFSRVPLGNNVKKLSPQPRLALDIGNVRVVGSAGEDVPSAQDVEEDAKVEMWTCGLREDGDGGNVLKRMKEAREKEEFKASDSISSRKRVPAGRPARKPSIKVKVITNGQGSSRPHKADGPARKQAVPRRNGTKLQKYGKKWQDDLAYAFEIQRPAFFKGLLTQIILPDDEDVGAVHVDQSPSRAGEDERQLSSGIRSASPEDLAPDLRPGSLSGTSRPAAPRDSSSPIPTTPSHWSPSVRGSELSSDAENEAPQTLKPTPEASGLVDLSNNKPSRAASSRRSQRRSSQLHIDMDANYDEEQGTEPAVSAASLSYLSGPTPAQRPNPNARPRPRSISPLFSSPSPSLSSLSTTQPSFEAAGAFQSPIQSQEDVYSVKRKVPYPEFNPSPPDPERSAVLVPDSDTSANGCRGLSEPGKQLRSRSSQPVLGAAQINGRTTFLHNQRTSTSIHSARAMDQRSRARARSMPSYQPRNESYPQWAGNDDSDSEIDAWGVEDELTGGSSGIISTPAKFDHDQLDSDDVETQALLTSSLHTKPKSVSGPVYEEDDVFLLSAKASSNGSRSMSSHQNVAISKPVGDTAGSRRPSATFALSAVQGLSDEASLRGAKYPANSRQPSASLQPPTATTSSGRASLQHDPVAWSQPSFMRRDNDKSKTKAMPVAGKPGGANGSNSSQVAPAKRAERRAHSRTTAQQARGNLAPPASSIPDKVLAAPIVPRLDLSKTSSGKRSSDASFSEPRANGLNPKRRRVAVKEGKAEREEQHSTKRSVLPRQRVASNVKDEPVEAELVPSSQLKLRGFRLDFGHTARSRVGLPAPMTEEQVRDCLLAIGKARHKGTKRS